MWNYGVHVKAGQGIDFVARNKDFRLQKVEVTVHGAEVIDKTSNSFA